VAKVAVISCNDRCCIGARQLSSLVKDRHVFYLICYGEYNHAIFRETAYIGQETDEELLLDLVRQLSPDLVGFSYRSIQANLAAHLAGRIQTKLNLPVIMGGIGATSDPERAIQKSPIVCIGEADFVLPALLDAIDESGSVDLAVRKTPNLWYHKDSGIAKNPLTRLVSKEELSDFPFMDYDPDNKFSIVRGTLIENDGRYDNEVGAYPMLTSRGCPFACTFCHNSTVHDLYCGQKYCRQRSVASVIAEMERAKARPDTTMFSIYDDLFNVNRGWTLEFAAEYGKRIKMPFWCYTHPSAVKKDVHQALLDVGLNNTAMGVQSGSERTLYHLYNRKTPRHKILESAAILKELNCRVQIDLITANPFEDDSDRRDTLDLMQAMPKITRKQNPIQPWYYCLSRLTFFPNSQISQMLEKQGINPEFDPDLASFWEMLYELALLDDLPQGAVMYLSYLYDSYKQSSEDFRPETGERWIRTHLLGRPLREASELLASAGDEAGSTANFIPNPENLPFSSVRVLMDAWELVRSGTADATRDEKLKAALSVLKECRPSPKAEPVASGKQTSMDMQPSLFRQLHSGLLHRFPPIQQIERKLRAMAALRRLLG
jgi:radical SAM superfamily enzyme YgiQ (UPF0313 family)